MNQKQLEMILFFVRRGESITKACHRMLKTKTDFYKSENQKLVRFIIRTSQEVKYLIYANTNLGHIPLMYEMNHEGTMDDIIGLYSRVYPVIDRDPIQRPLQRPWYRDSEFKGGSYKMF